MNDSTLDPQVLAERVGAGMFAADAASRGLGMRIESMGPGYARLSMPVRADMLNGFKICHGGFITTLADSAFAFACNSSNALTLTFTLTTGAFKGKVTNPYSSQSLSFSGVVLPRMNAGYGYALGTNQSSQVIFGP